MRYYIFPLLFIFYFTHHIVHAQSPRVPKTIQFADMTLRLNDQAQREIQLDVDALYRSPNYFQIKLDRVNLYMPTIERVLREQGVPQDLKYLVIQESSLISDAVSTSNAVGFWQFKKGTAEEVFMRVDNQIDERKNIVSSTKGAALYLKKHQSHLDNWMCALVSYQMGLGGARKYFGDKYRGKKTVDIDRNTHWYFKKFLAHKIAFESQLGKLVSNGNYLQEYPVTGPTSLSALSKRLGVTESHLKEYNKWTPNGSIPGDRQYTVTYVSQGLSPTTRPVLAVNESEATYTVPSRQNAQGYPRITGNRNAEDKPGQIRINGIKGILAKKTTTVENFATQAGVNENRIKRVNDLKKSDQIQAGQYYYTKRKKGKAQIEEHVVMPGETLWKISQIYGIRLNSLKAKNRIYKDEDLKQGMVLKLQSYRKRNEPIEYAQPAVTATASSTIALNTPAQNPPATPNNMTGPRANTATQAPMPNQHLSHKVQPRETLYAISRQYQVTVDQLREWNNLNENSILSIGQVIIIKK
ncbi:MAG TPA: LysM peptidoglycan-binding domain-containing protein [Cyclobacteriaceae bacterium]|nr:LysM peptidoglycan-binding domain-containing protein [Cyclobacteriaceae bacterium]